MHVQAVALSRRAAATNIGSYGPGLEFAPTDQGARPDALWHCA